MIEDAENRNTEILEYLDSIKDTHPKLYKEASEVQNILNRNDVPLTDRYSSSTFKPVPIPAQRPKVSDYENYL